MRGRPPVSIDELETSSRSSSAQHADEHAAVFVGFYKKATGQQTMTWSQAVDQALCFGCDRRRDAPASTTSAIVQRFTPRRLGSNWSTREREEDGAARGRGPRDARRPQGVRGAQRGQDRQSTSFERQAGRRAAAPSTSAQLRGDASGAGVLRRPDAAGTGARSTHWVVSAKKEETRLRRARQLIDASAAGPAAQAVRLERDRDEPLRGPGRHHQLDLGRGRQPRPVPGDPVHARGVRGRGEAGRGRGRGR